MTPPGEAETDPTGLEIVRAAFDRGLPFLHAALGLEARGFQPSDLYALADRFGHAYNDLRTGEFHQLSAKHWRSAADAARETFAALDEMRDAPPSVDTALHPTRLALHVRRLRPTLVARYGRPQAAYQKLTVLACGELIDLLREHPDFREARARLATGRRIPAPQPRPEIPVATHEGRRDGIDAGSFEKRYLATVAQNLDRLELFGVTLNRQGFNYPLSTAYISLTAYDVEGVTYAPPERIETVLRGHKRALIRGNAGSGKTTLLQRLAVWAAESRFPEALAAWNGSVPFFIPLRHFAHRLPAPEEFLDSTGAEMRAEMPADWVTGILKAGRGLVMIDGVDELPVTMRATFRPWLRALTGQFAQSRFIVTSRQPAVAADWLSRQGFLSLELRPMSLADQRAFVRHWHAAMREMAERLDEPFPEYFETDLANKLTERRDLRRLAANPLLAALVCALHHDRRMQLPEDRMKLYEAALEMLLVRRDEHKGVRDVEGVRISEREQESLLQRLAYGMLREGISEIGHIQAIRQITSFMSRLAIDNVDAAHVFRHLLIRTGLLREPSPLQVDFVHRTFQEYLAARQALEERDHRLLIRNAHLDTWREVFVMAVGHAREAERNRLLRGLLRRARWEKRNRYLLLLAAECLGNAPVLNPKIRQEIITRAGAMLPPRSPEHARLLAGLGEPILDLLQGPSALSHVEQAATVDTAALVGTEAALQFIARFARTANEPLQEQILRLWHEFDPEIYARSVLSELAATVPVRVDAAEAAHALRHIKSVRVVYTSLDDLTPFRRIPDPIKIGLFIGETVPDLRHLRDLPRLTDLRLICDDPPRNLEEVANLPALRRLWLTFRPKGGTYPLRGVVRVDLSALRSQSVRVLLEGAEHYAVTGIAPERVSRNLVPRTAW